MSTTQIADTRERCLVEATHSGRQRLRVLAAQSGMKIYEYFDWLLTTAETDRIIPGNERVTADGRYIKSGASLTSDERGEYRVGGE